MSDIAIRVEHLSKRYRIGRAQRRHDTLRDALSDALDGLLHPSRGRAERLETIWALRDVSFEVRRGEVVGIIGRNGAGKSTLLKILSRITEPTEGRAEIHGRVGSLLEVGTGFHPELSGRENIYLNGAILGMKRTEIARRFDEIVAFAEIEPFLDTPVKRYSSGMYVRLAFAVAAHLEPEILLVDEVLAVGDAGFQRKCLGKMGDVAGQGRTVLFVSHNMAAVTALCGRAMLLSRGQTEFCGEADQAVARYMAPEGDQEEHIVDLSDYQGRMGSGEMRLLRFWIENETGLVVKNVRTGRRCSFVVEYVCPDGRSRKNVCMSLHISSLLGNLITVVNTDMLGQNFAVAPAHGQIRFQTARLPLTAGRYVVDLNLATESGHSYADFIRNAALFDVDQGDFYGTGRRNTYGAPVLLDGEWFLEACQDGG
jgi:lipopolysaccharide transport system ATP-binding protein